MLLCQQLQKKAIFHVTTLEVIICREVYKHSRNFKGTTSEEIKRKESSKRESVKKQRGIMAKRRLGETEEQRQIRLERNRQRTRKRRKQGKEEANQTRLVYRNKREKRSRELKVERETETQRNNGEDEREIIVC